MSVPIVVGSFLPGAPEGLCELVHVHVVVDLALRLTQPNAVDDGGVVQCVADQHVFLPEKRSKEALVGVPA